MTFSIQVNDDTQFFKIGESLAAQKVIKSYASYQSGRKYKDLKNCFVSLYDSTKMGATDEQKRNACMASAVLASSVYNNSELDLYKRLFIATSVTSIIVATKFSERLNVVLGIWTQHAMQMTQEIEDMGFFDSQAVREAGLGLMLIK